MGKTHKNISYNQKGRQKMSIELIPPDTLNSQLREKLKHLKHALSLLLKRTKNPPEGHLRVAQKGTHRPQYYHYTNPDDFTGKYIRKNQIDFARSLAQNDYDEKIINIIQKEIKSLEMYLSQTGNGNSISEFYDNLCTPRRELITPVTLTNEQYAALWQEVSWKGRPFSQDAPLLYTARDERVRSKSEVIIADTLYRHKIPYRYEFPLILRRNGTTSTHDDFDKLNHRTSSSGTHTTPTGSINTSNTHTAVTLHPDFLCLNTRTRQEFYWEHFGLMHDPDYSKKAAGKLRLYTENGILPGRNLIITMETQTDPPSIRTLEKLIEEFLL